MIESEVIKSGKRFTTVTGTMRRDGRPMLQVLGSFGDVSLGAGGVEISTLQPPRLPPIEECVPRDRDQGMMPVPMMDRLDVLLRPEDAGFSHEARSGVAEMAGYFAFADGRPIDTLALLMVCDALPPAVFNLDVPVGWVPTIEYTVHIRGVPAPGPVQCVFRTQMVRDGFLEEGGEVWDSTGRLVAMSRQLRPRRQVTPGSDARWEGRSDGSVVAGVTHAGRRTRPRRRLRCRPPGWCAAPRPWSSCGTRSPASPRRGRSVRACRRG